MFIFIMYIFLQKNEIKIFTMSMPTFQMAEGLRFPDQGSNSFYFKRHLSWLFPK